MNTQDDTRAWGDFWKQNVSGSQTGGCLPTAYAPIEEVQKRAWAGFAKALPKGARVIDLATGDGRVMRWLLAVRRDVKAVGCDRAPELPAGPKGTKMRAGVSMEKLPFRDGQFHAVTSQFGFEYSELSAAAHEMARVLAPGGVVGLLTHRQDGPILAHNLARRDQIAWALKEHDVIGIAKKHLKLRALGVGGSPDTLEAICREGAQRFGPQSVAWEIPEAVRRSLMMGANDTSANVAHLLDTIAERAQNELGRIASLERACAQTADDKAFRSALSKAGLTEGSREALSAKTYYSPFADFRILTQV